MTDFEYDCWQKKILARQASHRKRGSKSKKCMLPSDYLTKKQLAERNGEVVFVDLSKPTSWEDFSKYSKEVQSDYIKFLFKKYNVSQGNIADMLGVSRSAFWRYCKDFNISPIAFPRGHRMNKEQRAAWQEFLGTGDLVSSSTDSEESLEELSNTKFDDSTIAEEGLEQNQVVSSISEVSASPMKMDTFSLKFSGEIDINQVANSLKMILGNCTNGYLEISFKSDS